MAAPVALVGLAFVAGVATILSPCILPILPILVGRSLQGHRLGPVALVLGLAFSFALAGSLLGVSAAFVGPLTARLRQAAIVLLLVLGLAALFPEWGRWLFGRAGSFRSPDWFERRVARGGLGAEFLIGCQLGLIWIPCAGPILGSLLALVVSGGAAGTGFVALFVYALGAGVPMLLLAYGSRGLGSRVRQLNAHAGWLSRAGGACIALAACAILLGWDNQLQLLLAPFFPGPPL